MSRNYELLSNIGKPPQAMVTVKPASDSPVPHREERVTPASQIGVFNWLDTARVLRRHWRSSLIFALLVWVTTTAVVFTRKSIYEPSATIEIDPVGPAIGLSQSGASGSNDVEYLETEAKKLESDELLVAVIRSLHLDENQEFIGTEKNSLLSHANPPKWLGTPQDPTAQKTATGAPIELSAVENVALRSLRDDLTVKRDATSRLVTAKVASHDPALAAVVTNTLVDLFIERTYTTRHDAIMESSQWLSKQLDDVRDAMQKSNAALADYENKWGIADLGQDDKQQSTTTQRIAQLNQELTQAQADRIELQSYIKGGNEAAFQQVGNDPVVQTLTQKLADARTALSESEVIYGKNHPNVKKLQSQVDELQTQLNGQRGVIIGSLQKKYAAAEARERLLAQEMKGAMDQGAHMGQYNILKKEAQDNRALYETLYMRVKEAGIAAESRSSNIRVVDRARVLDTPTGPHRMLIAAAGLFAGLFGGVMIAFARASIDNTIHSSADMRRSTGIAGVSMMPSFELKNGSKVKVLEGSFLQQRVNGSRERNQLASFHGSLLSRPGSPEAEAVRALQTSVMLYGNGNPPQILQVVSAFPGEGKTTIAVNLAIALSTHTETCIVDADLRKPSVARAFGITPRTGLGEVLLGMAPLEAALIPIPGLSNLTILPATDQAGAEEKLFGFDSMQETLGMLRARFRHIIVDTPPLMAYADGRAIAPLADGLILIGRSGLTTREGMAETIELLGRINAPPIIEVVLNDVSPGPLDRRYGYRYPTTS